MKKIILFAFVILILSLLLTAQECQTSTEEQSDIMQNLEAKPTPITDNAEINTTPKPLKNRITTINTNNNSKTATTNIRSSGGGGGSSGGGSSGGGGTTSSTEVIILPIENQTNQTNPTTCTETDQGIDKWTKGTTTGPQGTQTDYCDTRNRNDYLYEYYCSTTGQVKYTGIICDNECNNGQCTTTSSNQTNTTCIDTDGGIKPETGAYTKLTQENSTTYYDTCTDNSTLTEYYCGTSTIEHTTINCNPGTCTQNQTGDWCTITNITNPTTCTETDQGIDKWTKGTTTGPQGTQTDYCDTRNRNDYLYEYYCSTTGQVKYTGIICDNECNNGQCTTTSSNQTNTTCIDTDGGINIFQEGNVTVTTPTGKITETDQCTTTTLLKEWYCGNDTSAKYQIETCPTSHTCQQNKCTTTNITCGDNVCDQGEQESCPEDCETIEYMDLTVEVDKCTDLDEAGWMDNLSCASTVLIHTPVIDGLVIETKNLPAQNASRTSSGYDAPILSEKIWLYLENTTSTGVLYQDNNGRARLAGFLSIYSDTKNGYFAYVANGTAPSMVLNLSHGKVPTVTDLSQMNLSLTPIQSPFYGGIDATTANFRYASVGYRSLGDTSSLDEPGELVWAERYGSGFKEQEIGSSNEDIITEYGLIIKRPTEFGLMDTVLVLVPKEYFEEYFKLR